MVDEIVPLPPSFETWKHTDHQREIAVMMSGGVDSSVTAMLLRQAGWKVLGVTMKIPVAQKCDQARLCCGADAAMVAYKLGIPHYYLDTQAVFRQCVIEPFQKAYSSGATPNPCVDCNTTLKFQLVWDFVRSHFGIEHLATGHYARVDATGLYRASDHGRDQSYFLYGIRRERLPFLHFPLAELPKTKVRELAKEMGLSVADKPDSMELCFAGEGDYRTVLDEALRHQPGKILDTSGKVLGEHEGIASYTIGQRRGLRVAMGVPMYVLRISPRDNTVTLGTREESFRQIVLAGSLNVLVPEAINSETKFFGKIRSYGDPLPCRIVKLENEILSVKFDSPMFAPTPGQRMVLYDETDRVSVGGVICSGEVQGDNRNV
jgi:tRNA-specific 2-thiouridylase